MSARTQVFIALSVSVASLAVVAGSPMWAQSGSPVPGATVSTPAPASVSVPDPAAAMPVASPVPDDAALTINPAHPLTVPATTAATVAHPQASSAVSTSAAGTTAPTASLVEVPEVAALVRSLKLEGWQLVTIPKTDGDPERTAMLNEFGCKNTYTAAFQRGQRRIVAMVYCFGSSQGAYGAYNLLRRGSSTVIARGDASSEDDQSVSIWKDKCFISVFGTSEDDDESKEAVNKIANLISKGIASHGELPQIIMRLPTLDRVRGTEKVAMGPVSARRFFPAPSLAALSFANSYGAGIADYAFQAPLRERMKLMIVDYSNSMSAQRAYEDYIAAIEEQHPNVLPGESTQRTIFKAANSYMMCELRSQRILMISGARKKNAPLILSRQIL